MQYMVFAQYTGDSSNFEADLELARKKFMGLGASRLTGSVALTGEAAGSTTIGSIWDKADAYFDARPQVLADPEIAALMQARGMSPVQTAFTEVYAERGSPEGKYAVSIGTMATIHRHEAQQGAADAASAVMMANGVNGMRFTRAIAAGAASGSYIAVAYADSLDDYLAASAVAATDGAFLGAMASAGAQIVARQFNRMI